MLEHIIDVCVSRRIAVLAFTAGIAVYGFAAYQDTPIEAFPDVTNYQVNVITKAPGLAPEEVEKQITLPLERALNGTPGMIAMRSESLFGLSLIYQTFDDDVDAFKARALVTERVTAAAGDLPPGPGRRRRRRVRRLPARGPRRGRSGAPARLRPDPAGRPRRARPVQPQRRRRVPAPRRSGDGGA